MEGGHMPRYRLIGLLLLASISGIVAAAPVPEAWVLPEQALFFVQDPAVAWEKTPREKREWIIADRLAQDIFFQLDPFDAGTHTAQGDFVPLTEPKTVAELRANVLREWQSVLREDWLPTPELVTVALLRRPGGTETPIAYCAYTVKQCRMLLMSTLGRQCLIYLEQPARLPAGEKLIACPDLLQPAISAKASAADENAVPRVAWAGQEFQRYRGYGITGPFEPVRILFLRCRFPEALNLRTVGTW